MENIKQFNLSQTIYAHNTSARSVHARGEYLATGSIDKKYKRYIYYGSKDRKIYIIDIQGNPVGILEGHESTVCSLSQCNQDQLVSGSWDGTAIVWNLLDQSIQYKLEGHSYAVCVLAVQDDLIITGSQDKSLNFWRGKKREKQVVNAHGDIIRELCKCGEIGFLSCSNDETIKFWTFDGINVLNMLNGHSSFIFSVQHVNDDIFASGGEDRVLKIWKNEIISQDISHPGAIWSITSNSYGDIITACSDGVIRVFTQNEQRYAPQDQIDEFNRQVELINAQGPDGLSSDQLAKLPSTTQMTTLKGKNDGEVRLFKNANDNNKPEAYVWKQVEQKWDKIGDVVGSGAPSKSYYEGDKYFPKGEYDYIFNIEDDSNLKRLLPFNEGDSALEVAEKFIVREGLNKGYLEQITSFIRTNTKGRGKSNTNNTNNKQQTQHPQSKYFPYNQLIFFEQVNFDGLHQKLLEFNEKLKQQDINIKYSMNDKELMYYEQFYNKLKDQQNQKNMKFTENEINVFTQKLLNWPLEYLTPCLDILKIYTLHYQGEALYSGYDAGLNILMKIVTVISNTKIVSVQTLCLRILSNLFFTSAGKYAALKNKIIIFQTIKQTLLYESNNQHLRAALSSFLSNFSTQFYPKYINDNSEIHEFFAIIGQTLINETNNENILKLFVAIGNSFLNTPLSIDIAKNINLAQAINSTYISPAEHLGNECAECKIDLLLYL